MTVTITLVHNHLHHFFLLPTITSLDRDMRNVQFLPSIHSETSMEISFLPDTLILEICLFVSHDSTFLFSAEDQMELITDRRRDINWQ